MKMTLKQPKVVKHPTNRSNVNIPPTGLTYVKTVFFMLALPELEPRGTNVASAAMTSSVDPQGLCRPS